MADNMEPAQMTDDDWRKKLTPEQYHILREGGTEAPGTGALLHNTESGDYRCAACDTLLFRSDQKYDSTEPGLVGWPSFSGVAALADGGDAVELRDDDSLGMHRTEAICKTCGSHLGHLFPDQSSPTGQHFCINCGALDFKSGTSHPKRPSGAE
jgi:peptide-methionine (R)-S-oxide reductase